MDWHVPMAYQSLFVLPRSREDLSPAAMDWRISSALDHKNHCDLSRSDTYSTESFCALPCNNSNSQRWLIVKPSPDRMQLPIKSPICGVHLLRSVDGNEHYIFGWK